MSSSRWRERREIYLRESARTEDLVREGFINAGLQVVDGCGQRRYRTHARSRLVLVPRSDGTNPSGEGVVHGAEQVD